MLTKFAVVSFVTGASIGSFATQKPSKKSQNYPKKCEASIDFGYLQILKTFTQRPSSRLHDLVNLANCREKSDFERLEALRFLALYWQHWPEDRRKQIVKFLSADSLFGLVSFGKRVDESLFFTEKENERALPFDKLESQFTEGLQNLSQSSDIRVQQCSMTFIRNTLKEVQSMNKNANDMAKHFQPQIDFWPFDSNVSHEEEGQITGKKAAHQPNVIGTKKLELFLTPILKCLENAARKDDHKLAEYISQCLNLSNLLKGTLQVEKSIEISDKTKEMICAIWANLAAFKNSEFSEQQRRLAMSTGFLPILRQWAFHLPTKKTVSYQAIRALKNLDPFFGPKLKNNVGLYFPVWRNPMSVSSNGSDSKYDVIFVHGMLGGAVYTWRQRGETSTDCWPADWLPHDIDRKLIRKCRVFGVQYRSVLPGLSSFVEPLEDRAKQVMLDLEASGIGSNGIVWVTHSFGGIFVKSMLHQNKTFAKNTRSVVFLSTPHLGSPIADQAAKYAGIFGLETSELEEIRSDSPLLLELRSVFRSLARKHGYEVLSVSESQPLNLMGFRLSRIVVPEESALGTGYGRELRTDFDHLATCKPEDKECPIYNSVLNVVNHAFMDQVKKS